jgi:hypothetical protein
MGVFFSIFNPYRYWPGSIIEQLDEIDYIEPGVTEVVSPNSNSPGFGMTPGFGIMSGFGMTPGFGTTSGFKGFGGSRRKRQKHHITRKKNRNEK